MLLRAGTFSYEPTDEDKLWLRRAVEREGAPHRGVAQTLVNGFMYVASRPPRNHPFRGSLGDYVRAYSKAVNPRWFPEGDLFQRAYEGFAEDIRPELLAMAERRRDQFAKATTFSSDTESAVRYALTHGPALANATDFASYFVTHNETWLPLTAPQKGVNRFWARPGAWKWGGYTVDGAAIVVVLLVVFLGLAFAHGRA